MTKLTSLLVLLLGCLRLPSAQAQTPRAQVTLSLDEYEDLYSSAKLKDVYRKLQDQKQRNHDEHQTKLEQLQHKHHQEMFPSNFQVLEYTAIGNYNATNDNDNDDTVHNNNNMAVFDMQMTIRIMGNDNSSQQWTKVPLVANTTVASGWQVQVLDDDGLSFAAVDHVTSPDVLLLRDGSGPMELATSRTGLFRVRYQAFRHVLVGQSRTNNIHEVVMSQFLYPLTDFNFRIHHSPATATVREFSVQPVEAVWRVVDEEAGAEAREASKDQETNEEPSAAVTEIHVTLPLTADRIEIRWIDVDTGAAASAASQQTNATTDQKKPQEAVEDVPQVTAIHEVMHSVGEGMVKSSHILEYSSTSELSAVPMLFTLHGQNLHVISMEGHALQSWERVEDLSNNQQSVLRVTWKRSHLATSATLLIHTEQHLQPDDDEQVELPRIECHNVLRQVGHIGVTKDANVEVHQHSTTGGIAACEPTEISSQLRLNMDRPIVLSYKYLNPHNASVVLNVLVHVAMETLEAAVDRLHYKAVVTDTHTVHSLLMILQSTKLQYLELLGLPDSASMFTLSVNSVPAKPTVGGSKKSKDDDKGRSILVPLLVGLDAVAANAGRSLLTSVELSYISTHDEPMNAHPNGTLSLSPPHVKLPVSVLTTQLRLPKQYQYEFSGDFTEPPARELAFPLPSTYSYQTGKRVVEQDYAFSFKDDVWPDDVGESDGSDDSSPKESSVKIVTPNMGRSFHFHRLLVVDTQLALDVEFSEPKPEPEKASWWSRVLGSVKGASTSA